MPNAFREKVVRVLPFTTLLLHKHEIYSKGVNAFELTFFEKIRCIQKKQRRKQDAKLA